MDLEHPDREILRALESTRTFRAPRQKLAALGHTVFQYHLVTEPAYTGMTDGTLEAVVREGTVTAQKPAIVTPSYMLNLDGFGAEARRSMEYLARAYGKDSPGLLYAYKNEAAGLNIVRGSVEQVAGRIAEGLDKAGKDLAAVIVGVDTLWDVSLLKFIYEYTATSFIDHVQSMQEQGLLGPDPASGIPRGASQRIEALFHAVQAGESDPSVLKTELDRWDLFRRYEDRFLALFRNRGGR